MFYQLGQTTEQRKFPLGAASIATDVYTSSSNSSSSSSSRYYTFRMLYNGGYTLGVRNDRMLKSQLGEWNVGNRARYVINMHGQLSTAINCPMPGFRACYPPHHVVAFIVDVQTPRWRGFKLRLSRGRVVSGWVNCYTTRANTHTRIHMCVYVNVRCELEQVDLHIQSPDHTRIMFIFESYR